MLEHIGVKLKLRLRLKHHMILIHLRIHGVDLPLPESVIQRVVDRGGRDAETRRGYPIDIQINGEPAHLLIAGNVFQFRQLAKLADETIGPQIQLNRIGIFQRVLVLGPTDSVVQGNVLAM